MALQVHEAEDESFEDLLSQYEKIRTQLQEVLDVEQELSTKDAGSYVFDVAEEVVEEEEELVELELRLKALESTLGVTSSSENCISHISAVCDEMPTKPAENMSGFDTKDEPEETFLREVGMFTATDDQNIDSIAAVGVEFCQNNSNEKSGNVGTARELSGLCLQNPVPEVAAAQANAGLRPAANKEGTLRRRIRKRKRGYNNRNAESANYSSLSRSGARLSQVLNAKQRILSMRDPVKQCDEFLKMVALSSMPSSSASSLNEAVDNYDSVSMDLDNDSGSVDLQASQFSSEPEHSRTVMCRYGNSFASDLKITINTTAPLLAAPSAMMVYSGLNNYYQFLPELPPFSTPPPPPPPPPPTSISPMPQESRRKNSRSRGNDLLEDGVSAHSSEQNLVDDDFEDDEDVLRMMAVRSLLLKKGKEASKQELGDVAQDQEVVVEYDEEQEYQEPSDVPISAVDNKFRKVICRPGYFDNKQKERYIISTRNNSNGRFQNTGETEKGVVLEDTDEHDLAALCFEGAGLHATTTRALKRPLYHRSSAATSGSIYQTSRRIAISRKLTHSAHSLAQPAQFSKAGSAPRKVVRNNYGQLKQPQVYKPPPQHSPVVIPLSSDDEDEADKGSIRVQNSGCVQKRLGSCINRDNCAGVGQVGYLASGSALEEDYLPASDLLSLQSPFSISATALNAVKQSSGNVVKLEERLRACEADIVKHKQVISDDRRRLGVLQTQISSRRKEAAKADAAVQRLRIKLAKAEHFAKGRNQLVDNLRAEMQTVSERLSTNMDMQHKYENQLNDMALLLKKRPVMLPEPGLVKATKSKTATGAAELMKELEARRQTLEDLKKDCELKMKLMDYTEKQKHATHLVRKPSLRRGNLAAGLDKPLSQHPPEQLKRAATSVLPAANIKRLRRKSTTSICSDSALLTQAKSLVSSGSSLPKASAQICCDSPTVSDVSAVLDYESPLLCFRSYRFTSQFNKLYSNLLSPISHRFTCRLDPRKPLCPFELFGECKDTKCLWQHKRDYVPSRSTVISDILAYCSSPVLDDAMKELFDCFDCEMQFSEEAGRKVAVWLSERCETQNVFDASLRYEAKSKPEISKEKQSADQ